MFLIGAWRNGDLDEDRPPGVGALGATFTVRKVRICRFSGGIT